MPPYPNRQQQTRGSDLTLLPPRPLPPSAQQPPQRSSGLSNDGRFKVRIQAPWQGEEGNPQTQPLPRPLPPQSLPPSPLLQLPPSQSPPL